MSQFIKFYSTSSVLNMFRTLIYPSSGAYDFSIVSPHWLCVLVSMCVGVSVWLGWGGRVKTGRDGTRTETRFGLPAKRTSPFISAGMSVQSSTGFLGVRVGGERL